MNVIIEESFITFDSIKNKPFYCMEIDEEIQSADMVVLPSNEKDVLFPEVTTELFKYLCDSNSIRISVPVSDNDYKKIEKHCDLIELGVFLVSSVVLPIAINLLSNFLYDKLKIFNKKDDEVNANVEIIVEETKTKKSKIIKYKGPVSGVKDTLTNASKDLFDDK